MIHKCSVFILVIVLFLVSACAILNITPEMVQENLTVVTPEGSGKFPVVIYYQGTGRHTKPIKEWARWFKSIGVASAIVDNAKMRNRKENPTGSMYTEDAAIAWDLLKDNPKIDTTRFALMGFSRGGQQALEAGPHFKGKRVPPSFVFALYPGGWGRDSCGNTHKKPTEVHIFYGDLDDINRYDRTNSACKGLAKSSNNVKFHELRGATHCYDFISSATIYCCG
jgi:dienelactone hydrolase